MSRILGARVEITLTGWVAVALLLSGSASARSAFVLSSPPVASIAAATYDDDGNRIGDASLRYERPENGDLHLEMRVSVTGGARNTIKADFEKVEGGLRPIYESSISHDEHDQPMVLVEVDHEKGEARCTSPAGEVEVLRIAQPDRVANTTMSLLFQPLVRGSADRIEFQAFLCRGGARFMDFVAVRADPRQDTNVLEIRFGPDRGSIVSWLASIVAPRLRFWFDSGAEGEYLAHQIPLYSGGPEVLVVRDGVDAASLVR